MSRRNRLSRPGRWKVLILATTAVVVLAVASLLRFQADLDSFFGIYEGEAMVEEVRNGFRFSSMVLTREYMAASRLRGNPEPTPAALEKARSYYRGGIRILVRIRNENASSGQGSAEGDLLYSALGKGRERFSETLNLWQNGFKEMVFLEDGDGRAIRPVGHDYLRRWELGNEETVLLTFPDSLEGKPIEVSKCTLRFKEFGLSTGNLALHLIRPPGLRVRI